MVSRFTKMVLDCRFDDLNTTSRLARAVLQQREQIAHDISSLMNKVQITGLNLIWMERKRTMSSHISIHGFSNQRSVDPCIIDPWLQGPKAQIMPKLILLT